VSEAKHPWFLTFSYGRALQNSAIKAWSGQEANKEVAQQAFLTRAKANSEAQLGKYVSSTGQTANESLFVAGHKY